MKVKKRKKNKKTQAEQREDELKRAREDELASKGSGGEDLPSPREKENLRDIHAGRYFLYPGAGKTIKK